MRAPLPADEPARLAALYESDVLDTPPEDDFDDIALLAAEVCDTPLSMVSLVDVDRQWLKARVGVDLAQTERALSFCAHTVTTNKLLEIPDALADIRFAANPYVNSGHGVRFYAGAPVMLDGIHAVGTVSVADHVPRTLTASQRRALRSLARHAAVQLELRRTTRRIAEHMRRIDRMKDSFLATMSHELRTPLSSIRGYLEILLESDFDEKTSRRFLTIMQRNSDRLLRLIDDLMMVTRLAEGGLALDFAEVNLSDLVEAVTTSCGAYAVDRKVTLSSGGDGRALVDGDFKRLAYALTHLVQNAVKFTAPGGEVTVCSRDGESPQVVITDTGIGISEEDLPHVFERFFRSQVSEQMAVEGSGLGLMIVKNIIEAHNGTVDVSSTPGVGTTVRLTFPAPEPPVASLV